MEVTNLQYLMDEANLCKHDVAVACGLNMLALNKYLDGRVEPSKNVMLRLADLFAVPLDFLYGRCTKEECDQIKENYAEHFRILRKNEYENLLLKRQGHPKIRDGYCAPYPYDLLDEIFSEPFDHPLSEDEEAGLNEALASLNAREQKIIELYYREELSMAEASKALGFTSSRGYQVLAKAIRKLRHPSRTKQILYGMTGNELRISLEEREKELRQREIAIAKKEQTMVQVAKKLEPLLAIMQQEEFQPILTKENPITWAEYDTPNGGRRFSDAFMDLDLSVRAFNCLARAGLYTVDNVINIITTPSGTNRYHSALTDIRNLARKTYDEIVDKVENLSGMDLSAYYGGYYIFDNDGKPLKGECA